LTSRHAIIFATCFACLLHLSSGAQTGSGLPAGFDAYCAKVLETFRVPGMAVTVVKDGKVLLAKGYGTKRIGKMDPVGARTLFPIASNSKAFTAAALQILVEEGKVKWEDPVIRYLPWFRMSDPWVTSQINVRDLLVHNSGIPAYSADILNFPPTDYSRKEILSRLQQIPLVHPFRTTYAYDNILYLAAGEVIRSASGMDWEDFIRDRILRPLDMSGTISRFSALPAQPDLSSGHGILDGKLTLYDQALQQDIGDAGNPAGGIASNATDMAQWLRTQLDSGMAPNGHRIFAATGTLELWKVINPITPGQAPEWLAPSQPEFAGYASGLRIYNYGKYKIVGHGGKLDGFVSQVALVPSLKLGISVLTNQESTGAYWSVIYTLLDHFLQNKPFDWLGGYKRNQDSSEARLSREQGRIMPTEKATGATPPIALERFEGTYHDTLYGDIRIARENAGLVLYFTHSPQLTADLEYRQYDTFIARFRNRTLKADAWTTITLSPYGDPDEVKMKVLDPDSDLSFDGLLFKKTKK
jgi:CubicO group peptidase (beta-lactamase class C family)